MDITSYFTEKATIERTTSKDGKKWIATVGGSIAGERNYRYKEVPSSEDLPPVPADQKPFDTTEGAPTTVVQRAKEALDPGPEDRS